MSLKTKNLQILNRLAMFVQHQQNGIPEPNVVFNVESETPSIVTIGVNIKYFEALKEQPTDVSIKKFLEITDDETFLPGECIETAEEENFYIRWADEEMLRKDSKWDDVIDFLAKLGYRIVCAFSYQEGGLWITPKEEMLKRLEITIQIQEDPNWRTSKYRGTIHGKNFGIGESFVKNFDSWLIEANQPDDEYAEFDENRIEKHHAEALKSFMNDYSGEYVEIDESNSDVYDYLKLIFKVTTGYVPSDSGLEKLYDKKDILTYAFKNEPFPAVIDWKRGYTNHYIFLIPKDEVKKIIHKSRGHVHGKNFGI